MASGYAIIPVHFSPAADRRDSADAD